MHQISTGCLRQLTGILSVQRAFFRLKKIGIGPQFGGRASKTRYLLFKVEIDEIRRSY